MSRIYRASALRRTVLVPVALSLSAIGHGQSVAGPNTESLEQKVQRLEAENQQLRKEIEGLKKIRNKWFQHVYSGATPEQVRMHETHRERWEKVDEVAEALGVEAGSTVADIGAGRGFFAFRLSRIVGDGGRVYAVEIDENLVSGLKQRASHERVANVEVLLGSADNPGLARESLDAALLADVYHEMTDQPSVLGHVYEALKPGGRLVVVDYLLESVIGKSREKQQLDHSISPEFVKQDLREAGFDVAEVVDPFNSDHPAGIPIYLIVARRP